jgi:hypothetical protein
MKRSLGQKFFVVAIFGTFERYVTNLRGTFVENVKKSKINPPYTVQYSTIVTEGIALGMGNLGLMVLSPDFCGWFCEIIVSTLFKHLYIKYRTCHYYRAIKPHAVDVYC